MCCNLLIFSHSDLKIGITFCLKIDETIESTYQKAILTQKKQQPSISFLVPAESLICR